MELNNTTIILAVIIIMLVLALIINIVRLGNYKQSNTKLSISNNMNTDAKLELTEKISLLENEKIQLLRNTEKLNILENQDLENQKKIEILQKENTQYAIDNARLKPFETREKEHLDEISTLMTQNKQLDIENAKLKELENTKKQIDDFSKELERITAKALETQNEKFDKHQKESLAPLTKDITEFSKKVENLHKEGRDQNLLLNKELENLKTLNENLAKEAQDLTVALKGDNKKQGNWGEIQLKTLLDITGLEEGVDYDLQVRLNNNEYIPDCIVNLPNNRKLIIDAKVSLSNYVDYIGEDNQESREAHFKKHMDSLKKHIKTLSTKEYQSILHSESLDYVIMFIPTEQAYIDVLKTDSEFYKVAYSNNIAIATPSSLLPILRTVENLWRVEKRAQNADKIADLGRQILDKIVGFKDNLDKVTKQLDSAQETHKKAYNQMFASRSDSIRGISERMKELGASGTKSLSFDDSLELSMEE